MTDVILQDVLSEKWEVNLYSCIVYQNAKFILLSCTTNLNNWTIKNVQIHHSPPGEDQPSAIIRQVTHCGLS